jgi:hypothetical protein
VSVPPRDHADSRLAGTGPWELGLALATAYLVGAALLGTVLLGTVGRSRISGHPTMLPGPPTSTTPSPPTDTGTAVPPSPVPPTTQPPAPSGPGQVPPGYRRIIGPDGFRTVVPAGWLAPRMVNQGQYQVDDPRDRGPDNSGRFLRYGAATVSGSDMLGDHVRYEQEDFLPSHPGYRRVQLRAATQHGLPAVDWEFTWLKDGVPRHVHVLYWQDGGTEFNVYASSPQASWDKTAAIYDVMVAGSTP